MKLNFWDYFLAICSAFSVMLISQIFVKNVTTGENFIIGDITFWGIVLFRMLEKNVTKE